LARAVDRKALVDAVYDNVYLPATYWTAKGINGHQEDTKYDSLIGFDKTAAQKALSDAGYPNGQGFPTLGLLLSDSAINRNLGDFLVKQWKDNLGITVKPEFVDGKTRSARNNAHDFDLFIGGWQSDYPDIENFITGQFNTGGGNNQWDCSDPDIDAAVTAAGAATDDAARVKGYQKVEDLVIQKLCGVLPIYQNGRPYLVSTKLGGVTPNGVLDAGMAGNWCVECWFIKK
jgi:oligopeptide transport system substrate-binding protein